ncbi:tail fiber protein [Escherichia coli]|uniref:tail fiber protein n=16 Tax=Escherichia TaxID=561 RepID=UPI0011167C12|nr:phage tail protein [Escherichia coli]
MNDVTVVTSVTYPSPESLALVADVQYHEPYLSAALNRKFRGIVDPGFYAGFLPKPGGGMNLLITSVDGDKTAGAASVDIGEFYQVTIQQRKDISLALSAGKKYAIVLKGRYLLGEDTYQVNTASHIHAAEFVARTYTDSYQLGDGELLVCTVNIPAGVSAITQEMIDTSERINRTIGIDISDSVTSTRSDVAASSLAVKKAYDLAKSKYTAQDASTTQKGLVQLSSATNSDSETMAATPKAVKSIKDLADTKAPIESPSLTGTPTAPTAAQGTNSTQIANTAFVKAAITALINGAPGTMDTLKEIAAAINNDPNFSTTINNALALKAPLASPALTGIPTAPTAAQGTNNTQIATTAYVRAAISALVGSSPEALDTLNELAAALGNDPNFATTMTNALAGKQPLDATLTALAGLATGANKLPYFTGTDTVSQTDLTSVGRDILAKTSVLAVIQYLGLRELGTSGEKIPLLSTANTWSSRQTFNGGITGALTGNADTATKLKTAININGVRFDGSADITLTPKDLDVYSKSEIDNKKGMRKYTFSAPANAVSGKWYPIVFRRSRGSTDELASRVVITTYSSAGGYAMNNCEFNGFVMPGGWSDRGSYAAGFFSIYSTAERAIHSIISSVKDDDLCSVFYVEARAFPIKIFAEEGLNVIVPTTDYTVGQATYKWGVTDPVAESTNTQTILDFKNGRGYYCSHQFVSSLSGNAATATKLASSINIGGVSFDGSADIDLPGVNTKGNQDTTGNAATATKLQTACTINGISFDGSKNIELTAADLNLEQTVELAAGALQKNQNGADIPGKDTFTKNIGACRAYSAWLNIGGDSQVWTTAQFISWLESQGAFNHPYWMCKGSWAYANNKVITDTGCGNICLAGAVVEVIGTRGAMTIRVTTPSTSSGGGITNAQFTYINHGDAYAPGWRRDYNTKNQQPAFALGQTGSRVANDKAVGWNWNSGVYDADISGASTLILHFNMNAGSCPAVQFRVNYKNGGIFYRSARDGYGFEANWSEFYTTTRKPSAGDVGAYTQAECNSRFITGIRLGGLSSVQTWNGPGWSDRSGYVVTGSVNGNRDELIDTTQARPIQYCINGTWYNAGSI